MTVVRTLVGINSVELRSLQTERVVRSTTMANHALGSARIVPLLQPRASRNIRIQDRIGDIGARSIHQLSVRPILIPTVGITHPFILLADHQPRLDPIATLAIPRLLLKRKTLDQDRAIWKRPTQLVLKLNTWILRCIIGNRKGPLLKSTIAPKRGVD